MASGNFHRDLVQRVRSESDLVGFVSRYVSLKKTGQNMVGLCPFHSEKTPSFTVSPSKQIFHCFGCHAGGDVISFLMKMEGTTFPDTVRNLAEQLGIPVPAPGRNRERKEEDRSWVYRIHNDARDYYHDLLMKGPAGKPARDYLNHRGIRSETASEFHLGFAPDAWESLGSALTRKGWTGPQMEKAGLVIARDANRPQARGYYDRFRNRLLFPITDLQGRVCGFGGRVLNPEDNPKYLNSPESPVFTKGRMLYGLDRAREHILREDRIIVVEGYMDVLSAHQAGIRTVVATLGTALTESHLHLVRRFTQKLKLIFDSDAAGVRAALRSVELIAPTGLQADVVRLPDGQDPDSFILKHGAEAFNSAVSGGSRLMDFAVEQALADPEARSVEGKLRAVRLMMPMIRKLPHPVERGHYLSLLASRLQIHEQDLREVLRSDTARIGPAAPRAAAPPASLPKEEEILIHLLLHREVSVRELLEQIRPDDLSDPRSRQILKTLVEWDESADGFQLDQLLHHESIHPDLAAMLTALSVREPDYEDRDQTLADCLRAVRNKRLLTSMKDLEIQIGRAEREGRSEQVRNLQNQWLTLKKKTLETGGTPPLRQTG